MAVLYQKFSDYLKTLSLREKILLLLVGIALIYAVWDALFFGIFNKSHQQFTSQIESLENDIIDVNQQISEITAQIVAEGNPNQILKDDINKTNQQIKQIELELTSTFESLVPPKEITNFIRSLLSENSKLKLIALNNEPVQIIDLNNNEVASDENKSSARLYQHATNIKLVGDYVSLYNYLLQLEQSEWTLYWDQLQYQVKNYPNAEITLRIYTLSSDEYWLGL